MDKSRLLAAIRAGSVDPFAATRYYKDSPSPPPAPDYAAAATAQGAANTATAAEQARLNNPNITTPYGSQTVTFGQPSFNQDAYNKATMSWVQNGSDPNNYPTISQYTNSDPLQPTITQTLAPAQQQLLDSSNRISNNLAGVAESGLNRVSQGMNTPFDTSSLPSPTYNVNGGQYQTRVRGGPLQYGVNGGPVQSSVNGGPVQSSVNGGPVQSSVNGGPLAGNVNAGNITGSIDTSGVQGIPTVDPQARQHSEDLAYQAATSRLDPQWAQRNAMSDTQLRNQGLVAGGEAYDNAKRDLGYQQNDAYLQAQNNAVNQGLANQQAQFNMGLQANQTGFGEAQNQAQFQNAAQGQQFGQGLSNANLFNAAQGQQFGQGLSNANLQNSTQAQLFGQGLSNAGLQNSAQAQLFGQGLSNAGLQNSAQAQLYGQGLSNANLMNSAQGQQFSQGQQNAALNNQASQQMFQQGLANANLSNAGRQQSIQEQAYLRSLPLNELNALRTGAQVTNPQFSAYNPTNIGQTPIFQGAQAQGQAAQNMYNVQQGAANSFNSGLMSAAGTLGGAALTFSDRRLKSNIVRIGTHPLGIGVYEYDIFGDRQRGVMADEVLTVMPEAVSTHESGFHMVDYGRL